MATTGRPDHAARESTAPGWKSSSQHGRYAWLWDGKQYTTRARWNGSSWTYTDIAPGWKLSSQQGDYAWWDGTRYTTAACPNGSSWEYTDIRPQPTDKPATAGLAVAMISLFPLLNTLGAILGPVSIFLGSSGLGTARRTGARERLSRVVIGLGVFNTVIGLMMLLAGFPL